MYTLEQLEQKNIKQLKEIGHQLNVLPDADCRCRQNWINAIVGVNSPLLQLLEVSPAASVEQVQPIIKTVETPSAVEVEPVQTLPIESKFGRIVYPWSAQKSIEHAVETSPGVEVDPVEESIVPAAETSSGSRLKASTAHQLLELFKSSAHIIEDSPGVKTEATVSESAIAPAAKISLDAESDQNPILTGITLSDGSPELMVISLSNQKSKLIRDS